MDSSRFPCGVPVPLTSEWFQELGRTFTRFFVRSSGALGFFLVAAAGLPSALAVQCELYPMALSSDTITGLSGGELVEDALNGDQPGNFGWLSWSGSPSAAYLEASLTSSLSNSDYVNPNDPDDLVIDVDDWIHGSPGAPAASGVKAALELLVGQEIIVPVWDQVTGQGNNVSYRVSSFARVELVSFDLKNDDRVTVQYLGAASCDESNQAPIVDAGEDQAVFVGVAFDLNGVVNDDGLPLGSSLAVSWAVMSSPASSVIDFGDPSSESTTVTVSAAGEYQLRLSVSDGEFTSTDEVTVQADLQNFPPTADAGSLDGDEDSEMTFTPTGSDPDGNSLIFQLVSPPLYGAIEYLNGVFEYTPIADYNGEDSFSFLADDGELQSEPAVVSITVFPVNDPPSSSGDSLETDEDISLNITLDGFDVDEDSLTYEIAQTPSHGGLSGLGPARVYSPDPDYNGSDFFTYRVYDGELYSGESTISIFVNPVNDGPTTESLSYELLEDGSISFDLSGNDVDSDPLVFEVVGDTDLGQISGTLPNVIYTPDPNVSGQDGFQYRAFDGELYSDMSDIALSILPVNDAPYIEPASFEVTEGQSLSGSIGVFDIDSTGVVLTVVTDPAVGTLTLSDYDFIYQTDANQDQDVFFEVQAFDGLLYSNVVRFDVSVLPVNDPPSADALSLQVLEDVSVAFSFSGSDPDGDALSFELVSSPSQGQISGSFPDVVYSPDLNVFGLEVFQYRAFDGIVYSDPADVSIDIIPVNDLPALALDPVSLEEDSAASIDLTASDIDSSTLTYAVLTQPSSGSLSGSLPLVSYAPDPDFNGSDSFSISVDDNDGGVINVDVSITVLPINDAPVGADFSETLSEGGSAPLAIGGLDADGDDLQVIIVDGADKGILSQGSGGYEYTAQSDLFGPDLIEYRLSDGTVETESYFVLIDIEPVNPEPQLPQNVVWGVSGEYSTNSIGLGTGLEYQYKDIAYQASSGCWSMAWLGGSLNALEDSFHFAYLDLSGDQTLSTEVTYLSGSAGLGQAGLMMRSTSAVDSAFVSVSFTNDDKMVISSREQDAATASSVTFDWVGLPEHCRLMKAGEFVRVLVSDDGILWRLVAEYSCSLSESYLGGLYSDSSDVSELIISEFKDFSVMPTVDDAFKRKYAIGEFGASISFSDAVESDLDESYLLSSLGGTPAIPESDGTFVSVDLDSDFQLTARLAELSLGDPDSTAGLMLREGFSSGSVEFSISYSNGILTVVSREIFGGAVQSWTEQPVSTPVYLRISLLNGAAVASYSSDGLAWQSIATSSLIFSGGFKTGLFVSAASSVSQVEGVFDEVELEIIALFDDSAFVSQNVPYAMGLSETGQFEIVFENIGTTTWRGSSGYKVVWAGADASPWGLEEALLPALPVALPGETFSIFIDATSPSVAGDYASSWVLANGLGETFGEASISETVTVVADPDILDADSDGMPDLWEIENFGNVDEEPSGDFDNDGVSNIDEFNLGLSPADGDTDDDGLSDGDEIAGGFNPLHPDHPDVELQVFAP